MWVVSVHLRKPNQTPLTSNADVSYTKKQEMALEHHTVWVEGKNHSNRRAPFLLSNMWVSNLKMSLEATGSMVFPAVFVHLHSSPEEGEVNVALPVPRSPEVTL